MTRPQEGWSPFKYYRLDTHPEEIANTCRDSHGGGTPEENAESGAEFGGGTGIGAEGAEDSEGNERSDHHCGDDLSRRSQDCSADWQCGCGAKGETGGQSQPEAGRRREPRTVPIHRAWAPVHPSVSPRATRAAVAAERPRDL